MIDTLTPNELHATMPQSGAATFQTRIMQANRLSHTPLLSVFEDDQPDTYNWFQQVYHSARKDTVLGSILDEAPSWFAAPSSDVDPDFDTTEFVNAEYLDAHPWMINPFVSGILDDMPNMERFLYFEARQKDDFETRERLGMAPFGKQLIASLPGQVVEALAGGIALKGVGMSGKIASFNKLLTTGPITRRLAIAAGSGAAANVMQEQLLESVNPNRNVEHRQALAWAAGMGLTFGAAVPLVLRGLSAGGSSALRATDKRIARLQETTTMSFDAADDIGGAMGAASLRDASGRDGLRQSAGAVLSDLDPDGTLGRMERQHIERLNEYLNGKREPSPDDAVVVRGLDESDTTHYIVTINTPKTVALKSQIAARFGDEVSFPRHIMQHNYDMLVADARVIAMTNTSLAARFSKGVELAASVAGGEITIGGKVFTLPGRFKIPARPILRDAAGVVRKTSRILFDPIIGTAEEVRDPVRNAQVVTAEQKRNILSHQRNVAMEQITVARRNMKDRVTYENGTGETLEITKRTGTKLGRAAMDWMRRTNAGNEIDAPPVVTDTAKHFTTYMQAMERDLLDVGMLNKPNEDIAGHVPRRWLIEKIRQNKEDFRKRILANWRKKRFDKELDERELLNSVIDAAPGLRKQISKSFAGNGIDDVNPAGAMEQPFGQATVRKAIELRAPGITDVAGGAQGVTQRTVDQSIREQAESTGDDYLQLLGEQYKRRKADEHDFDEKSTGINAARLRAGDEWKIGNEPVRVVRADEDGVTVTFGEQWRETIPGVQIENPDFRQYVLPRDKKLPGRKGSVQRTDAFDEAEDIALHRARAKQQNFENLTEQDLHDIAFKTGNHDAVLTAYEEAYDKWLEQQSRNLITTMIDPGQSHGGVEHAMSGTANPLKNRTLDIDEDEFLDYLDDNLFTTMDAYHRHVSGRLAARAAIKSNIDELEPIVRDLTGKSLLTGTRLDDFGKSKPDPYNPQLLIEAANEEYNMLASRAATVGDTDTVKMIEDARSQSLNENHGLLVRKLAELENRASNESIVGWRLFMERQIPRTTFMASLGKMTISAQTDIAAASFAAGLSPQRWGMIARAMNLFREIPKTGIETQFVALTDAMQNLRMMELGEIADIDDASAQFGRGRTGRALAATDRGFDYAARQFSRATLMGRWNTNMKRSIAIMVQQDIIKFAPRMARLGELLGDRRIDFNNLTPEDKGLLRQAGIGKANAQRMGRYGFGADQSRRLVAEINANGMDWQGTKSVRSSHKGFINPNMGKWADKEIAERLIAATDAETLNLIVEPKLLSRPLANEKIIGRLINQFQSFAFSYGAQLVPVAAQRPAQQIVAFMGMATMMGIIADTLHNALSGRRTLEESITQWQEKPMGMIYAGIDRSGMTTWLSRPLGLLEQAGIGPGKLLGNERLSSMYGRPNATGAQIAGPAFGWAENLARKGLIPAVTGHAGNPRTQRALWNSLPYHNLWIIELMNRMVESMGYNIPGATPLGRRQ